MIPSREAQELGLAPPERRLSAQACFQQANRRAAYPALAIMSVGYAVVLVATFALGLQKLEIKVLTDAHPGMLWKLLVYGGLFVVGLAPLLPAWFWMSGATQRWRVWALQNVDNWQALQNLCAEKSGQKWPREAGIFGASPAKLLELRLIAYRDSHDE